MPSTPPPAVTTQAAPAPTPCATAQVGIATFGVDQTVPLHVMALQTFVLAMRGGAGESYIKPYRMRVSPSGPSIVFDREFTIADTAYTNADRAPGTPYAADGGATQFFSFKALSPGTTTVTFDEFSMGNVTTPYATKTFTIVVTGNTLTC